MKVEGLETVFPDDLPLVIEYRLGPVSDAAGNEVYISKCTYPFRSVSYISTSGKTDACMVCPRIPYGASGWRPLRQGEFRPMKDIPKHWLPFLQRERQTEMDPRPHRCRCGDPARETVGDQHLCFFCYRKWQERHGKKPIDSETAITGPGYHHAPKD